MYTTEYQSRRAKTAPPMINVTPLIDVLLVLLIIFFVIQPHDEARLPVRAPEPAHADDPPAPPEMLMLTVSIDSNLALNSQPVTLEGLLPMLANLMEKRPPDFRALLIKAPPRFSYGDVVLFVDLARGAGVDTVGLIAGES